jgi:multidrug efflux pump subunit AcrB
VFKLADVADVRRGYEDEDPATFLIRGNREPTLVLCVIMQDGWNGLDLGKALDAEEQTVAQELLAGLVFSKITSGGEYPRG